MLSDGISFQKLLILGIQKHIKMTSQFTYQYYIYFFFFSFFFEYSNEQMKNQ